MKRILFPIFWVSMGAFFLFAGYWFVAKKPVFSVSQASISQNLPETKSQPVVLMAVGDIMLGRGTEYMVNKYGKGDFNFLFAKIKNYLLAADLLFGNLEGSISQRGQQVGSIYSFEFSPTSTSALKESGFDVLSLANNHMLDYQAIALQDTLANLQQAGIDYVGAGLNEQEAFSLKIREIYPVKSAEGGAEQLNRVKGVKIGFLAFENLGPASWKAGGDKTGMAWIGWDDFGKIQEIISQSKQQVDILVVSLHAGVEYQPLPDNFQKEFTKMAIDSGADLVIGHHPHVIQPLEKYKNGWIAYSLGNFVFDQFFSKETMEGGLLKVEIKDKKISNVILDKVKLNKYYQPELVVE
ncbi:MAG: CapA family protein [Candidatus Pacebacteria bacterium]|nr:CapA family protein [Candidatus Paceibacterota bacterium]